MLELDLEEKSAESNVKSASRINIPLKLETFTFCKIPTSILWNTALHLQLVSTFPLCRKQVWILDKRFRTLQKKEKKNTVDWTLYLGQYFLRNVITKYQENCSKILKLSNFTWFSTRMVYLGYCKVISKLIAKIVFSFSGISKFCSQISSTLPPPTKPYFLESTCWQTIGMLHTA